MNMEMLTQPLLWGVTTWRFGLAILLVFVGFAARRIILALFRGYLKRYAERSDAKWDDELVEHMPGPFAALAQILIWHGAAALLQLPQEPVDVRRYVFQGLGVAIWLASAWLLFRVVDVLAGVLRRASEKTESKLDDQIIPMVRKTLKIIIAATILIMLVQNLGYSVSSLLASLGVGGLALALAAKDTVANLFGSLVVFTDRPFQIGDWIQVGSVEGTVEEVGFRTTRVRRFDKSLVTLPNSTFSATPITNHSARPLRRISMTVGVSYEASAEQLRGLLADLRQLLETHPDLDQGFHFVHFVEFADSSLNLQIYCFTKSTVWTEFLTAREELMLQIMDLIQRQGLEMAYPTRTVYLRDEQWPDALAARARPA